MCHVVALCIVHKNRYFPLTKIWAFFGGFSAPHKISQEHHTSRRHLIGPNTTTWHYWKHSAPKLYVVTSCMLVTRRYTLSILYEKNNKQNGKIGELWHTVAVAPKLYVVTSVWKLSGRWTKTWSEQYLSAVCLVGSRLLRVRCLFAAIHFWGFWGQMTPKGKIFKNPFRHI